MLHAAVAVSESLTREDLVRFFGVLSHDLKSPIFTIDGFSDLLLANTAGQLDEESSDFLQRIRGAAKQMKRVLDDMSHMIRLLSRPDALRPVDLNEVLQEVRLKHNALNDDGGSKIEVAGTLPTVIADAEKLREAFGAIVANALIFTDRPTGERIVRIDSSQTGDLARICVEDNGIGMDPRYIQQAFELGLKLDKSRGTGAGYGLYLARRVIEGLGGTLDAESTPGEGSRFVFTLPLAHS
jgi:signal transduction histidine kinase